MKTKITLVLCLFVLAIQAQSIKTLIYCGQLIDGKSNEAFSQMTVTVEGNKILSVSKGFQKPGKTDKVIDIINDTELNDEQLAKIKKAVLAKMGK